jgi:hypothetical protein
MNLEEIASLRLDTLITINRNRASLGIINEHEISAIAATIEGNPSDIIDDWRLIAYRLSNVEPAVLLLGINRSKQITWITSNVRSVDLDHQLVQTMNSLYGLGTPGAGEPPLEQLFLLITQMRHAGLAGKLGLPEVSG